MDQPEYKILLHNIHECLYVCYILVSLIIYKNVELRKFSVIETQNSR